MHLPPTFGTSAQLEEKSRKKNWRNIETPRSHLTVVDMPIEELKLDQGMKTKKIQTKALLTRRSAEIDLLSVDSPLKNLSEQAIVEESEIWRSCCFRISPKAAHFFALLSITVLTLSFCFYLLLSSEYKDDCPIWALVGVIIGFWFEAPRL